MRLQNTIDMDIQTKEDVKNMVDTFYAKAKEDDLIGELFVKLLEGKWDSHMVKLYSFWETILKIDNSYVGHPVELHTTMHISKEMFDRWVDVFVKNVDDQYEGTNAERAKLRAKTMARAFYWKLKQMTQKA